VIRKDFLMARQTVTVCLMGTKKGFRSGKRKDFPWRMEKEMEKQKEILKKMVFPIPKDNKQLIHPHFL
jgi:hypothetical protein